MDQRNENGKSEISGQGRGTDRGTCLIFSSFNRKIIVVKYGGSAMVDENLKSKCDQGC